jgi:hypothetical protein
MRVRDIMTKNPLTISEETGVEDAARMRASSWRTNTCGGFWSSTVNAIWPVSCRWTTLPQEREKTSWQGMPFRRLQRQPEARTQMEDL